MIDLSPFIQSTGYNKECNNGKGKPDPLGIITPVNIVSDMSKLFLNGEDINDKDVWDIKILDIACKSGNFLRESLAILMHNQAMIHRFPDENYRREWILNNQLYGAAISDMDEMIATRNVYGQLIPDSHIIKIDNYIELVKSGRTNILLSRIKEAFGIMQFDRVVGNPPYSNGIDIDFVFLGYELLKPDGKLCMITPAKWQTAEADQRIMSSHSYGNFREKLVPHMSDVVYYPDCLDVFGIQESSGITYYLIDKQHTFENKCTVKNKCNLQKYLNSTNIRDITNQQSLWNIGNEIVEYLGGYKKYKLCEIPNKDRKEYTLNINKQHTVSTGSSGVWDWTNSCIKTEYIGKGGVLFNKEGKLLLTGGPKILKINDKQQSNESKSIFTSNDIEECKSFYSWFDTKFTRFFILINISQQRIINSNSLRLVPAPPVDENGKCRWDHIYTDEELYRYFKLDKPEAQTKDGIRYTDIINAILRERN